MPYEDNLSHPSDTRDNHDVAKSHERNVTTDPTAGWAGVADNLDAHCGDRRTDCLGTAEFLSRQSLQFAAICHSVTALKRRQPPDLSK